MKLNNQLIYPLMLQFPLSTTRCIRSNASGNKRTSLVWLDFNHLSNEPEPITTCKHCHRRYICGSKAHETSNILAHSEVCLKKPANMLKYPRQSNLVGEHVGFLVRVNQRYNAKKM